MKIVSGIAAWRDLRAGMRGSIGFVPTMGHLHEGHLALVRRMRAENDIAIASIFVNPTQFNQPSDYEQYRRVLEEDAALLEKEGIDYLFHPDAKDMYPDDYTIRISETEISKELEGIHRPGHFTGMLTIVLKLLNLVRPDRAYFGEKDYQQYLLIKKMAAALFLPSEIIPCPTVREESGLARSSRNTRLTPVQKDMAAQLHTLLQSPLTDQQVQQKLDAMGFDTEYVTTQWGRRLAAAWLGDVRLIDNIAYNKEEKHAAVS
ncbi:MAG: pantoate--beta-alanine ligase [Alphaproteobacteria bacterium]|nr:pantoate--beta-alanine ligase [Alphaproteobacteria bacterium]